MDFLNPTNPLSPMHPLHPMSPYNSSSSTEEPVEYGPQMTNAQSLGLLVVLAIFLPLAYWFFNKLIK